MLMLRDRRAFDSMVVPVSSRGLAPRGFARRRGAALALGLVMLVNTACYTYKPLFSSAPQAGQRLALEISDQGRVRLGDQLGAGVLRIEGTLNAIEGNEYVISVTRVRYISGTSSNWGGERVRLLADAVARVEERKFSKARTMLAVGSVVVAAALFVVSRDLLGFGQGSGDDVPPRIPPGNQ
jgi:hypothetical protein